jgi:hypothetical protein
MRSLTALGPIWDKRLPPAEFWKRYDAGEFNKATSAVVASDRKPITTFKDPAFQKWMKEVAALPAEKQVEAVAKKLQELNPGFDGKVTGGWGQATPSIDNGVVTDFGFCTNNVTDVSPVRALERLGALKCDGTWNSGKNKFSDLSPLKGMPLTLLRCFNTWVSDLTPLKGMPLTELYCNDTRVSDLSPLEGMKLTTFVFTPRRITKGLELIRQMKSLKAIGFSWERKDQFPPDVFWKKYDAGEFGK